MILHKRLGFVPVMYEGPGDTSGGQGAAPPAAAGMANPPVGGGVQAPVAQPTAQQGDFNWGLFPDVPEDQRPLLQPHLRGVMGHVTRVEQQYAPYKAFIQAGYTDPGEIQGLLGFATMFDQDPLGTWFELGQNLQQSGDLSEEIDFDEVRALMDGTYADPSGDPGASMLPEGLDPSNPLSQIVMQQQQMIEELRQGLDGIHQSRQDEQVRRQQARSERLLERAVGDISRGLMDAGIPEEQITRELVLGQLAVHRGDVNSVINTLTGFRNAGVNSVIRNHTQRPGDLRLPRGVPQAPRARAPGSPRDSFASANESAMQMMLQQQAAAGQEA